MTVSSSSGLSAEPSFPYQEYAAALSRFATTREERWEYIKAVQPQLWGSSEEQGYRRLLEAAEGALSRMQQPYSRGVLHLLCGVMQRVVLPRRDNDRAMEHVQSVIDDPSLPTTLEAQALKAQALWVAGFIYDDRQYEHYDPAKSLDCFDRVAFTREAGDDLRYGALLKMGMHYAAKGERHRALEAFDKVGCHSELPASVWVEALCRGAELRRQEPGMASLERVVAAYEAVIGCPEPQPEFTRHALMNLVNVFANNGDFARAHLRYAIYYCDMALELGGITLEDRRKVKQLRDGWLRLEGGGAAAAPERRDSHSAVLTVDEQLVAKLAPFVGKEFTVAEFQKLLENDKELRRSIKALKRKLNDQEQTSLEHSSTKGNRPEQAAAPAQLLKKGDQESLYRQLADYLRQGEEAKADSLLAQYKEQDLLQLMGSDYSQTLLHIAAHKGDLQMAQLLKRHAGPRWQTLRVKADADGFPPVHYALEAGNPHLVELLLEEQPAADDKLMEADCIFELLEEDTSPLRDFFNYILEDDADKVKDILHKADKAMDLMLARWTDGQTALHVAVSNGQTAIMEALLAQAGSSAEELLMAQDDDGDLPLHYAFGGNSLDNREAIAVLLQHATDKGAYILAPNKRGEQPLFLAISEEEWEVTIIFLKALKADGYSPLRCRDGEGSTILHWAALHGRVDVAEVLWPDSEVDQREYLLQRQEVDGKTPKTALQIAAKEGHKAMTLFLLEKGAFCLEEMLMAFAEGRRSALHYMAYYGLSEAIALVLKVDVTQRRRLLFAQDQHGRTALHYVANGIGAESARLLLQAAGAEKESLKAIEDCGNHTAMDYALKMKRDTLAAVLLE